MASEISIMTTDCLAILSVRVATMALLVLFMSSQAAAEICIDVDLRFKEREPSAALVDSMKKEAASIWESYGVRFEWAATTSLTRCEWAQASFDVLIDHDNPHHARTSKIVLGSTSLTRRAIDHPIYIDRGAIQDLLDSLPGDQLARVIGRPTTGPADVGRALGRVLAHEVGHVILDARDHQPRGLMRPTFLPDDLVRPARDAYTLSAHEVARLRQRELDLNASASIVRPPIQVRCCHGSFQEAETTS